MKRKRGQRREAITPSSNALVEATSANSACRQHATSERLASGRIYDWAALRQITLRVLSVEPRSCRLSPFPATVIQVAGCDRACPGCISSESWPDDAGEDMSIVELAYTIIDSSGNAVFTGGEPAQQLGAISALVGLLGPVPLIALYTGYELEELQADPRPEMSQLLDRVDLISAGPFVRELGGALPMAGSSNQTVVALSGRVAVPDHWLGFEAIVRPDGSLDGIGIPPTPDFVARWHAQAAARGITARRQNQTRLPNPERKEPRR
jgi:anaerobic ribonucleoside-triphosphate reductase activating protein